MLTSEIVENYQRYNEDNRLKDAYGILEEAHTRRLILRHLTSKQDVVMDIGGGTGPYAHWLAELGYGVHFSDLVPQHVQLFRERNTSESVLSIGVEDARQLSYADACADVVILNGPLYHLPERSERIKVLSEAKRVLKPGGRLLAFTISRFAGLNYSLSSGQVFNDDYYEMVHQELLTGIRNNQELKLHTFTRAYFHLQEDIEAELDEVGFCKPQTFGVLGPAWNTPNLEEAILNEFMSERLLEISEMMEPYPMHSPKMMTVGIKQE